jgi:hypothetical protein
VVDRSCFRAGLASWALMGNILHFLRFSEVGADVGVVAPSTRVYFLFDLRPVDMLTHLILFQILFKFLLFWRFRTLSQFWALSNHPLPSGQSFFYIPFLWHNLLNWRLSILLFFLFIFLQLVIFLDHLQVFALETAQSCVEGHIWRCARKIFFFGPEFLFT